MKKMLGLVLVLCLCLSYGAMAQNAMPISEGGASISVFCLLDGKASASLSSLKDNYTMQYYEKLSGVDVTWYHPSSAISIGEGVNLVLASDDLPDLIFAISEASESLDSLVEQGVILRLNELIPQYAPNLAAILEQYPEIVKQITTNDGNIALMPNLRLDPTTRYFESIIIRDDWLEKLGLEFPVTVDDWYTVLKAFKTMDPNGNGIDDELPFVGNTNEEMTVYRLSSFWGFNGCFYKQYATSIRDGKVVFAIDAPEFDDWVKTMAQWYSEGLIDPEYISSDATTWKEKVLTDRGGAFYGKMNGGIGTLLGSYNYEKGNPDFSLRPVSYVTTPDGKSYDFYSNDIFDLGGAAVSANSKNVEVAMRWVDYLYSPEGQRMASFGVEGETYELDAEGKPYYAGLITAEEKLSRVQAIAKYSLGGIVPRMVNDSNYWNAVMATEQQREVYPTVSVSSTERKTPQHLTYPQEDEMELVRLMGDIGTFYRENLNAFIMGKRPLSELGAFKEDMHNRLKLDEAIALMQTAYDNYISK